MNLVYTPTSIKSKIMRGLWILDVGMSLVNSSASIYSSASIGTFMHGVVGMSLVHGTQQIIVSTNQNVEPHQWVPGHHPSSFGVIYQVKDVQLKVFDK